MTPKIDTPSANDRIVGFGMRRVKCPPAAASLQQLPSMTRYTVHCHSVTLSLSQWSVAGVCGVVTTGEQCKCCTGGAGHELAQLVAHACTQPAFASCSVVCPMEGQYYYWYQELVTIADWR